METLVLDVSYQPVRRTRATSAVANIAVVVSHGTSLRTSMSYRVFSADGRRGENVVVACVPCNQRKAGRTPLQAGMRLLSTPVKPKRLAEMPRDMRYERGMPEASRPRLSPDGAM